MTYNFYRILTTQIFNFGFHEYFVYKAANLVIERYHNDKKKINFFIVVR